ncbi:MAG: hypothetical protein AB7S26_20960 [Sandaracinaceae bacterium]
MQKVVLAISILSTSFCAHAAAQPAITHELALGAGVGIEPRYEYGSGTYAAVVPEVVGLGYTPLVSRWLYLRAGGRVGVDGLVRPEFARDLRVDERGFYAAAEVGLVLDAVVVPSLSVGLGPTFRWIDASGTTAYADLDQLDAFEASMLMYANVGLGIPVEQGLFVVEPYARFFHVLGDDRAWLRLGVELTVGFDLVGCPACECPVCPVEPPS